MEELLLDIIKESNGLKGGQLREACQNAYGKLIYLQYFIKHTNSMCLLFVTLCNIVDLLSTQQGTTRDPSHELRRVCFLPLQIALETKRPKLISLSLNGFHVK